MLESTFSPVSLTKGTFILSLILNSSSFFLKAGLGPLGAGFPGPDVLVGGLYGRLLKVAIFFPPIILNY